MRPLKANNANEAFRDNKANKAEEANMANKTNQETWNATGLVDNLQKFYRL